MAKNTSRSASTVSSPNPTTSNLFSLGVFVTIALAIWRAYSWPTVSCPGAWPPNSVVAVRLVIGRRLSLVASEMVWKPSVPGFLFSSGTCSCRSSVEGILEGSYVFFLFVFAEISPNEPVALSGILWWGFCHWSRLTWYLFGSPWPFQQPAWW